MTQTKTEVGRLARRHSAKRTKTRRQLEARGVPPEEVERIVERLRVDQQQHRDIVAMREAETPVDDSKHRPTSVDPLLKGAGRATGQTAAAVKRGKTMTKYQHQATERRQETA
jgi:hypothetical protein